MTLNVGQDFKSRWLNAPEAVRQTYKDDLMRLCELLEEHTNLQTWIDQEQSAQQQSFNKIEQAYTILKIELIEQARIRKQQQLEKALTKKREQESQYATALQEDEMEKFTKQTEELKELRHHIEEEMKIHTARYQKNPDQLAINSFVSPQSSTLHHHSDSEDAQSLRLRLELEADNLIEHATTVFRAKLYAAAQEEIEYLLKHTKLENHD